MISTIVKIKRPPSSEQIREVERQIGTALNPEYLEFIRKNNGGVLRDLNIFDIRDGDQSDIRGIFPFEDILKSSKPIKSGLNRDMFPIAYDSTGNYIVISNKTGSIYFFDHELHDDEALIPLARSLGEFLRKVRPVDRHEVRLQPGQVKSVWIDPDFLKELKAKSGDD